MKRTGLSRSRAFAAVLALAFATQTAGVRAGMIGAEALGEQSPAELDRAKVQAFLDRANVKERLQAMGVSGLASTGRVEALTDAEVHALAQRIDALPAGGELSNQDLILILLIVILVAIIL